MPPSAGWNSPIGQPRVFQFALYSSTNVANRQYIEQLQAVILQLHNCKAEHVNSEHVKETYQGETVWEGTVEVFTVSDHPRAKRAHAWSDNQASSKETFTAGHEIPPARAELAAV